MAELYVRDTGVDGPAPHRYEVWRKDGRHVCDVYEVDDEAEREARKLAAVDDLLAACKAAYSCLGGADAARYGHEAMAKILREAIAKAEPPQ